MAIYQYYLAIVPRQGIEQQHDAIPNEIGVSSESGYFKSDVEIYWNEVAMKPEDIISKVDLIVDRAKWGNGIKSIHWKSYSEEVDNDAAINLDEESLTIREFSFRADLRENGLTFLKNMIELGEENNWLFMDRKGKLMNPYFEEIKISIKDSNAYSFLNDPIKFLKKMENKNK